MRVRGTLLLVLVAALLVAGCGGDDDDEGGAGGQPTTKIANKPAGLDGQEFCAGVPADMIKSAIAEPYRTYDAIPVNDFPAPGVVGYECQWEWRNAQGDIRSLKVDLLQFDGALEGSLDASWKGTVDLVGPQGVPADDVGEEAITVKTQGGVTLSARAGQRQVTVVSSTKGAVPPAAPESLALVAAAVLDIGE
ncbi:MAG TPA: hypothetical protein VHK88_01320 [Aquihabitans sp.]|jgi:hypothetical protein|nr:hypothetical protein [Aquihabitans sp.]